MFLYFEKKTKNPKSIQMKVWFDIHFNFIRRGREDDRDLTKNSFERRRDGTGRWFLQLGYIEKQKKRPGGGLRPKDFTPIRKCMKIKRECAQSQINRFTDPNCTQRNFAFGKSLGQTIRHWRREVLQGSSWSRHTREDDGNHQ